MSHARRTGFVNIDPFAERKPGIKHLVDLVHVLDIMAYLAFDGACRVDEPGKEMRHEAMRAHLREIMYAYVPRNRNVASIAHRMTVPHDVVESSMFATREQRSATTQTTYLSTI